LYFLRHLALTALREGDRAQAAEASREFISLSPRPYTKETWESIVAITHGTQDRGFELLRTQADEANALLGAQAAQKKILDCIAREQIVPYSADKQPKMDWQDFEKLVVDQHGSLGREAVLGARMMNDLLKEDWARFGTSYLRYFETAISRSPYSLHSLSYQVLRHVNDTKVLEIAIEVMRWQVNSEREWPVFGRYDPTELDTYARLLHKVGRTSEALEWQERAVAVSGGRDQEILENLQRMRAKSPHHGDELAASTLP
jgi:hypothetical protein